MGLLNPRNFFSPFTNKVHLTTILLAGLIVGVLRLSLGKITIQHSDPSSHQSRQMKTLEKTKLQQRLQLIREKESPSGSSNLSESKRTGLKEVPVQKPTPASKDSAPSLADIEKELGLR